MGTSLETLKGTPPLGQKKHWRLELPVLGLKIPGSFGVELRKGGVWEGKGLQQETVPWSHPLSQPFSPGELITIAWRSGVTKTRIWRSGVTKNRSTLILEVQNSFKAIQEL